MLDLKKQEEVMQEKLRYYEEVIAERPPEYGRFKRRISIPRIKRALQKIADGTYGYCEGQDCENRIPEERLKLVPAALLCVECQKEFEENQ